MSSEGEHEANAGDALGPILGEGREAEVYAWGEDRVVRLLRDPTSSERLDGEEAASHAAESAGVPVPGVYGRVEIDGRPGLVMGRVDGDDQMSLLEQEPWRFMSAARQLGAMHSRVNEAIAPLTLRPLRGWLRARIEMADRVPAKIRRSAVDALDALPDGDRLCHGDFHPGNLLLAARGPVVIDWTNASRGEPEADIARTLVLLRLGEMPPGTSRLLRTVDRAGRTAFTRGYVRSYRRSVPFDEERVERWIVPQAAARASEGIEGEIPQILALLKSELELS